MHRKRSKPARADAHATSAVRLCGCANYAAIAAGGIHLVIQVVDAADIPHFLSDLHIRRNRLLPLNLEDPSAFTTIIAKA
jgi:hypothetical protein